MLLAQTHHKRIVRLVSNSTLGDIYLHLIPVPIVTDRKVSGPSSTFPSPTSNTDNFNISQSNKGISPFKRDF